MLIEHRSASLSFLITWIATNLSVRVPFRDNIYCVFIRLFTNTVIISIYSYCHNKGILSLPHGLYQQSNESNSVRWFDLLSPIITATITVPQCYLKVTTRAGWRICHLSKTQHIWVFFTGAWPSEITLGLVFWIHHPELQYRKAYSSEGQRITLSVLMLWHKTRYDREYYRTLHIQTDDAEDIMGGSEIQVIDLEVTWNKSEP